MIEVDLGQVTVKPIYPTYSYFVLPNGAWKVMTYEDHVDVWRGDSRGRWRRRKTLPPELARYESLLTKYEVSVKPEVG